MNIVVETAKGFTVVRPDTTWERYNRDFYVPDYVAGLYWTPVVYATVIRPGKFIKQDFAHRYLSPAAYGVLFYPVENRADGSMADPEQFAQACCLNHSSFLPSPFPDDSWSIPNDAFALTIDGAEAFATSLDPTPFLFGALERASQRVLLRNGDLLALELQPRQLLASGCEPAPGNAPVRFVGRYANAFNPILDFQVIK